MEKTCIRCGQTAAIEVFSPGQNKCKPCIRIINKEIYSSGLSKTRSYDGVYAANIMRTFGMTLDDYNSMLERQSGVCAVCREPESVLRKNGQPYRLAVDHNHRTMQVRGLVCRRCNQVVWAIEEHAGLLADVTRYLEQFASP